MPQGRHRLAGSRPRVGRARRLERGYAALSAAEGELDLRAQRPVEDAAAVDWR